jgi:hypothetical protein
MGVGAPEPEGLVAHPISVSLFFHVCRAGAIQACLVSAHGRRTNCLTFLLANHGHFLAFMRVWDRLLASL